MPKSIDIRSAIIGGLVVALVVVSIGAVRYVAHEEFDRFEMKANADCAFVLDTATGQVWALQTGFSGSVITTPPHTNLEFFDPKTYDVLDSGDPDEQ